MSSLSFTVPGIPVAQGSKRHVGRGVMIESSKNLQPWRDSIIYAAREAQGDQATYDEALSVYLTFIFPRPKSHYRTAGGHVILRDDAPAYKSTTPDLDKLIRAVLDACTQSGVWRDDAQVCKINASKYYLDASAKPYVGVFIYIEPAVVAT